MTFPTKKIAEIESALNSMLDRNMVKQRSQSGRTLFYLEGWHVIAEANRIFGFDNWTRETVDMKCVAERQRKIGANQKEGWGVTYIAKVRINVHGIVREGTGSGHGVDVDLGLAHESAVKEAETDAMKRAFMTFGNPFGLALYDKDRANVGSPEEAIASNITEFKRALIDSGLSEHGIKTLCKIANVAKVDLIELNARVKLVAMLRDEAYVDMFNEGKNSKGEVVNPLPAVEPAVVSEKSIDEIAKEVEEAFS